MSEEFKLPKWCGCVIRGQSVPPLLAEEICVRTTGFSVFSNSRKLTEEFEQAFPSDKEKFQILPLRYLRNSMWCSACAVQDSWITWDGNVEYDSNLADSYPSIEELTEEWTLIAEAFPTLSLTCQLYPCEFSIIDKYLEYASIQHYLLLTDLQKEGKIQLPKASPVVQFTIEKGKVTVQYDQFQEMAPRLPQQMSFLCGNDPYFGECRMPPANVACILRRVSLSMDIRKYSIKKTQRF